MYFSYEFVKQCYFLPYYSKTFYFKSVKLCRVLTMQMDSECPYSTPKSIWKHGLDSYPIVPKISLPDIFIYLVEIKSYQNHFEALGAYKGISSESQQAVTNGWVREFMAIALTT
ncbi:Uncharacterized protein APZ42_008219 [Daphnia magna]|uniref:Uncharacterized protein n=1 Tax=Daphnia magna TaxID=35525 RepID=A0A164ESU4_9CRUS|nr:Uncharacterized protein APZ42_008219 [Daphnia magna]